MSRGNAVSAAQIARGLRAMKEAGTPARAVVFMPDGSAVALTEAPELAVPSGEAVDWVDYGGEADSPRN